jgi:glycosyltransferase involved in cell wall biosynthesis
MKAVFFHNTLATYRIPFFVELNKILQLHIGFTNMELGQNVYGEQACTEFLQNISYSTINKKKFASEIKATIRDSGCDIVNLPTPDGIYELLTCYACLYYAKKYRKKTAIFWIRWVPGGPDAKRVPAKQKIKNCVRDLLARPIVQQVDVCICAGKKSRENFLHLGVEPAKICQMHYSTDAQTNAAQCDIRRMYDIPGEKKIVLYFGRVIARKGLLDLIKAFEALRSAHPDYTLVVAGAGDEYLEVCKQYCSENKLEEVRFLGQIPSKYRGSFFEQSDIFVLPSIFDKGVPEPWGQTVNEALQCGCRVLATDAVGAAYDVLNAQNGCVVRAGDVDALRGGLANMMQTQPDREQIKKSISEYTCAQMAQDFLAAYLHTGIRE